jgi:uncharacterized membrane protein YkoI
MEDINMFKKRVYWVIGLVALLALTGAAVTTTSRFALAGGSDDDQPITGQALDKASEAALAHTGGGRVTGTEVGDEDSYYQVEVTLDDGSQVDVQLDQNFAVVGQNVDSESADDQNGAKDDQGQLGDQNADTDNVEEQSGDQNADTDNVEEEHGDQNAAEDGDATAPSGTLDDGKDLLPQAGITLEQAVVAAQSAASGMVGEVDLEKYDGKLVFNVDIGAKDVKIDAADGSVIAVDSDD